MWPKLQRVPRAGGFNARRAAVATSEKDRTAHVHAFRFHSVPLYDEANLPTFENACLCSKIRNVQESIAAVVSSLSVHRKRRTGPGWHLGTQSDIASACGIKARGCSLRSNIGRLPTISPPRTPRGPVFSHLPISLGCLESCLGDAATI